MMKKVILVLGVLFSINLLAQKSFEKNDNVIGFGGDLGIYKYTSKIASSPKSETNAAANKMLNLHYERGILNWLGVGAKLQYSDYFTSEDTVTKSKPSIKAFDATLLVNAHFVRTEKVDMLAGFNVGYSSLNWEARDQYISGATGGGLVFDLHLQPRFYFGDHVGMFINLAYVHYGYKNMDFKNTFYNESDVLDLAGGGVNFGLGLQAKF
jgi:hypothetical protein